MEHCGLNGCIYAFTKEGKKVLNTRLVAIKLQKVVLDDLTCYHDAHYKTY